MGNCLIKQLQTTVEDTNLTKMGELIIYNKYVKKDSDNITYQNNSTKLHIVYSEKTTIYVENGNFTNSERTENLGNTITGIDMIAIVTPGSVLHLPNKYKITNFVINGNNNICWDFYSKDFNYFENFISFIYIYELNSFENVNNILSNNKNLITFNINNSNLFCNIDAIDNLPNLENLILNNASTGDISKIPLLPSLKELRLGIEIYGNVDNLQQKLPNLENINIYMSKISGNLDFIFEHLANNQQHFQYIPYELTGDLGKIRKCKFITFSNSTNCNFIWNTPENNDNLPFLAIEGYPYVDNIDQLLIDMNKRNFEISSTIWYNYLYLKGNRTSVSDQAYNDLISKGVDVRIIE